MKIWRLLLLSAVFSLLFVGCYITRDFRIEDGEISHGSMTTIEGDFNIGKGAEVSGACNTISGNIDVESLARVQSLSIVDGDITIGKDVEVKGDIKVVDGNIHCGPGTKIFGDVGIVEGEIKLEGTFVEGNLTTYAGDIKLYDNTTIRGNIIIKDDQGDSFDLNSLYIEITDGSDVEGDIVNKNYNTDVTVYLSNGGRVKGHFEDAKAVQR